MRRMYQMISLLALSTLLTACISIPIGDQTLEISTDGINMVSNDEKDDTEEDVAAEGEGKETDGETAEQNDSDGNVTKEKNQTDDSQTAAKNCGEQDYSPIKDDLEPGFYIPDCAVLTSVEKAKSGLYAYFEIEGGNAQEIFKAYQDYFGDKIQSENQNISSGIYEINANEGNTLINLEQYEDHVNLRVIQQSQTNDE